MFTRLGGPRMRSAAVALTVTALLAAGMEAMAARATAVPAASPAAAPAPVGVEDQGAGCPVSLPGTLTANSQLPDPFTRLNGTRISTTSDWTCRREEIVQLAEKYVYGAKPAKPASVTGTVTRTGITVNVSDNGKSASFTATVTLPSTGSGPFPAVLVYGGFGADTSTILASGAAVINYNEYAVGAEGTPRTNKSGAFYSLYGSSSSTGLLMAWAWGVSRIIDVVAQSDGSILKPTVGVTGCSRFGKGAIVAGAFDQRIALTMPIESGTGGVPIFRGVNAEGAQTLSSAYSEQPWLGDAFGSFTSNPATLPIDTHEVIGLVAPRGLFIMDNPHITNLGPKSGSVAALGAAEIYKALGDGDNITYWSDIQDANHCDIRPEWKTPLQQNIQKFLLRTGNAPGSFHISPLAQGDLSQWRTWTTPILTGGTPSATPSSTPSASASASASASPSTSPSASPTAAPGGCSASVSVNAWSGGFTASVNVTAGSSAIHAWTVTLNLPPGAAVTNSWNATPSGSSGAVRFSNLSYDGSVGAGQTANFGFQGTGTGQGTTVASCTAS